MDNTRVSLLVRLKDNPRDLDWRDFFDTYSGVISWYARQKGLSDSDAQDVLQETMVDLMRALPGFTYNREKGLFRNFLLTITHRRTMKALHRVRRRAEVSMDQPLTDDGFTLADTLPAAEDDAVGERDEQAWRESIFQQAWDAVRKDATIKGNTLDVFEAYVINQQPAAEVAARFGLKENAVYQIRNRLMKRLQEEVAMLMPEVE